MDTDNQKAVQFVTRMSSASPLSPDRDFLTNARFCLVFLGTPLLLAWVACVSLLDERRTNLLEWQEQRLERRLVYLESSSDTTEYLVRLLRRLERMVFSSPQPEVQLARLRQSLNRRFPETFEFTLLDRHGLPIPTACDFPVPRAFLQRFAKAYQRFLNGDIEALTSEKSFMQNFFGPFVPLGREFHGSLHYANSRLRRRYVYVSTPHPSGLLIVHLSAGKNWDSMVLRDRVAQLNQHSDQFRWLVVNTTSLSASGATFGVASDTWRDCQQQMERSPLKPVQAAGWLFMKRAISSQLLLVGGLRKTRTDSFDVARRTLTLGFMVLFLFSYACIQYLSQSHLGLSIRIKLVLAFSYTAGIPLIIMGFLAGNYLREREQVLENRLYLNLEQQLAAYDGRFLQSIRPLEERLQKEFLQIVLRTRDSLDEFTTRLPHLRSKINWDLLKLFNEEGKPVFTDSRDRIAAGESKELGIFDKISGSVLRNLNQSITVAGDQALTEQLLSEEASGEISGTELEWVNSRVTGALGRMAPYDFGHTRFMLALTPLFDVQEYARYLAVLIWNRKTLEQTYVRQTLLLQERRLSETSLFAYHRQREEMSFPRPYRLAHEAIALARQTHSSRQSTREHLHTANGALLALGIRGQELSDYTLIALSSDREIRHELEVISWRFRTFALILLGISSTVGFMLARRFITPIQHLTDGVTALQQRQFETRIPLIDQDEFGHLAQTFNTMIEGLEDLEVARVIQESLFPQGTVHGAGWEIYGTCHPATQVGGDYLDYFPLEDGRLVFVLGDVSGHGVSAALVMAMAKALIAHPATTYEPAAVLGTMQSVFLQVLKRKKMMTCCFGLLTPGENKVLIANAGQNFPFHLQGGTQAVELEMPGKPLGVRNTRGFECHELTLTWRDVLVLYTDGLVEASDRHGDSIGYERTKQALPDLIGETAQATEERIRQWHESIAAPGPQADDISLIIIQSHRLPGAQTT
ncbi:MAG TPA: SpoIIE family protein phosphatase [Candidatus Ozemobacteraceae bacterium]|nr:SpoIIE family protein phosphatase [Candidatus Ozemobacteraceae bacterium]